MLLSSMQRLLSVMYTPQPTYTCMCTQQYHMHVNANIHFKKQASHGVIYTHKELSLCTKNLFFPFYGVD